MDPVLYYNGPILTMEGPGVQAVLVENGVIKGMGKKEDFRCISAQQWDLQGRTLMPAFLDSHSHITAYAQTLDLVSLSHCQTNEEIVTRLKEALPAARNGWLMGFGYDHNDLPGGLHPTCHLLDQVSSSVPILITHKSGHMGVFNSKALSLLGITAQTVAPSGGKIGKENGKPNGYVEEAAFFCYNTKIPTPTLEQNTSSLQKAQQCYLANGIGTIQDGKAGQGELSLLSAAAEKGLLQADVVAYVDLENSLEAARKNHTYVGRYQNHLKIGGYKIFLDGSPQGRTAWLSQPYEQAEDGYRGYPSHTNDEVLSYCSTAAQEGMQLLAHCNGDAAAEQYIAAVSKTGGHRPVMIHAQTLRPDQLPAMKALGIIPSYFVAHTYYWGETHRKNLGEQRASRISPLASTVAENMVFTLHQDTPVIEPNMIETVWCAVNRITKEGSPLGEAERISPLEALKAVTINAAYQYFEEDQKGSIAPGKRADLVILSDNPLTIPPMEIKDIQVLATIKDGRTVFER